MSEQHKKNEEARPSVSSEQKSRVKNLVTDLTKFTLNNGVPQTVSRNGAYYSEDMAETHEIKFSHDALGGDINTERNGIVQPGWLFVNGESGFGKTGHLAELFLFDDRNADIEEVWTFYPDGNVRLDGYNFNSEPDTADIDIRWGHWLDSKGIDELEEMTLGLKQGWPELAEA